MFISLARAFITDGFYKEERCQLDLSQIEYPSGCFPFKKPVEVKWVLSNKADALRFNADIAYTVSTTCDRCFEPVEPQFSVKKEVSLVREKMGDDNDEIIEVPDERFDLDSFIIENIILDMPAKFLCHEECKGLCSSCGINLNRGTCNCTNDVSPFAVLKQLLEE